MTAARAIAGSPTEAAGNLHKRESAKRFGSAHTADCGVVGPTSHRLVCGDARDLSFIPDESIQLIVTSPPYWTLKQYCPHPAQMGHIDDYQSFLGELCKVWHHCYRVLVPGARLICVVGDVCLSRRAHGRHLVVPLHADITVACRDIGFDNLNPIIWLKFPTRPLRLTGRASFWGSRTSPTSLSKMTWNTSLCSVSPATIAIPLRDSGN